MLTQRNAMPKLARFLISFLLSLSFVAAKTQESLPFAEEIRNFKKQDSMHMPQQNAILFVGSSSFNFWKDVQSYFPAHAIINRGFGGSRLLDVIMYADDVIFPYHPKQIVVYCGENDLAYIDTVSAATVANRFALLFDMIRSIWDSIPIAFVSIKPSPSRASLMPKMLQANSLIKKYLDSKPNAAFIDVYSKMLTADGKLMPEIYIEDKLHMNAKGYAIWQKAIEPYLVK